jgi:outer membrane biosynthesis protein TonB
MKSPIHHRTLRLSLSLLLLLTGLSATAQTADDFFHGGAVTYLSNNIPGALMVVTNGLQRFPEDEKLKKLYELLNQQQQQQQQQKEQKEQEQKEQEQKQKDEQKQKQDQQKQPDQKKPEDQKPDNQKSENDKSEGQPEEKKPEPKEGSPQAMTAQQAKQMLDAQKGEEQVLPFKPEAKPNQRNKKLKDW